MSEPVVAAEWFDSVPLQTVLDAEPFTPQTGGDPIELAVTRALESVFNWSVGVEHRFNDKLRVVGGFRTDKTPSAADPAATLPVTGIDLSHVSGGASFALGRSELTLGMIYAWGEDAAHIRSARGEPRETTLSYRRLRAIIGFNFSFGG